ncbi:3-oxoacyl-[acyl-carrier protein] reductase [Pseudomonas sp. NFACC09-4]|uniref:SDR family oxidoreductase n=1 Tax=Pseudomonas TaxID=286 RepID=UPI0009088637|nr:MULTISPECIES: SDR family oxidoreductase [Pseudomonas]MDT8907982.1 SDR family oxidoreductase [Pseudomonas prosekii]NHN70655.1 SDR family oxidoreductase [Pseudomonas fluorescens]ROO32162.1 3-ketoacyl-ACP reductase [Pseudomonas sp. 7SR1]ROO34426.1 3-ketoacyl-ACP reductase [Pseudomonas sp. AF76]SFW79795.1 3-oxoacyl-[acyl-carrier protein] reductase [Pseudomonas sp. NFACC09-4]
MIRQTSKVAIVTGASRGIGAQVARQLAEDGFAVAINYANNAIEASKLVVQLRQAGHQALAIKADVSCAADVRRMFDETETHLGKVDLLVNNAGILQVLPLAQHSDELFEQTFAINTRGTFNTLREAATRLNDGGRIVNFSSSTVGLNLPGYSVYIASKAAVESLTQVFAKELRGRQITVNAIAPGPVATELFMHGKSEEQVQHYAKMPPLERLGQPEDIARIVSFLASPAADWVNGQVLRANGGLV